MINFKSFLRLLRDQLLYPMNKMCTTLHTILFKGDKNSSPATIQEVVFNNSIHFLDPRIF